MKDFKQEKLAYFEKKVTKIPDDGWVDIPRKPLTDFLSQTIDGTILEVLERLEKKMTSSAYLWGREDSKVWDAFHNELNQKIQDIREEIEGE